jgi:heparanase
VLKPASDPAEGLRVYAHCMKDVSGGVAVLGINKNRDTNKTLAVPAPSELYTMTAPQLGDTRVELNGKELKLGPDDSLPEIKGGGNTCGPTTLPPCEYHVSCNTPGA